MTKESYAISTEELFLIRMRMQYVYANCSGFHRSRPCQFRTTKGVFMVDILMGLAFVGMILTPFIVVSIHRASAARVITRAVPRNGVRPSVR